MGGKQEGGKQPTEDDDSASLADDSASAMGESESELADEEVRVAPIA